MIWCGPVAVARRVNSASRSASTRAARVTGLGMLTSPCETMQTSSYSPRSISKLLMIQSFRPDAANQRASEALARPTMKIEPRRSNRRFDRKENRPPMHADAR
jgi:hypothetical protein